MIPIVPLEPAQICFACFRFMFAQQFQEPCDSSILPCRLSEVHVSEIRESIGLVFGGERLVGFRVRPPLPAYRKPVASRVPVNLHLVSTEFSA